MLFLEDSQSPKGFGLCWYPKGRGKFKGELEVTASSRGDKRREMPPWGHRVLTQTPVGVRGLL
jgi:hypothetical protein